MTAAWDMDLPQNEKLVLLSLCDQARDDGYCWPSMQTIARRCGVSRRTAFRIVGRLRERGLLRREGDSPVSTKMWVDLGGCQIVTSDTGVTSTGDKLALTGVTGDTLTVNNHHIEPSTRERAGDDGGPPGFDEWWAAYPKKVGKAEAAKKFAVAVKKGTSAHTLLDAVRAHAARWAADKTEARFIPNPATWLHQGRYDDPVDPVKVRPSVPLLDECAQCQGVGGHHEPWCSWRRE